MPNPKPPTGPSKINMIAPVALVLIAYTYLFHSPQQAILQNRDQLRWQQGQPTMPKRS